MALLVAVVTIALAAAGCGDDDESASSDTGTTAAAGSDADSGSDSGGGSDEGSDGSIASSSISKAQFVKRANAICRDGADQALRFETPDESRSEAEIVPEAVEQSVVPAFEQVAEEIRALGAPAGDEEQLEAFLDAFDANIEEIEAESASFSSLGEVGLRFEESAGLAREYGIARCAYSPAS